MMIRLNGFQGNEGFQTPPHSKLAVQHFSAWGGSKEWHVDMPSEEEILALCIGVGWLAVATDRRNLRIFSTSGIQRDVLSIPGPVVCLAAFEEQLMVVFHSGMGETSFSLRALKFSSF